MNAIGLLRSHNRFRAGLACCAAPVECLTAVAARRSYLLLNWLYCLAAGFVTVTQSFYAFLFQGIEILSLLH